MRWMRSLAMAVVLAACTTTAPPPVVPSPTPATSTASPASDAIAVEEATVIRHVDGDTFWVRRPTGEETSVRFIGVDTPERGVPGFDAASAFTERLAPLGSVVFLELDVEERDRYERLLAYVWLERPPGRTLGDVRAGMLNARLVARGWAAVLTIPPNDRYAGIFIVLRQEAELDSRGLWAR